MRPFDPAPDLLADAQAVNDFMSQGMACFEALATTFGLADDPEGALQLGIALQAYTKDDADLGALTLKAFAASASRLPALSRVFEVLYKAINSDSLVDATHWAQLAVELYGEQPQAAEAQRLILEFFTYFGLWNNALSVHALLPADLFEPWRRHLMLSRARAEGYQPKRRFSFVLLTWNRADLLDRCLAEIRAKAGSEDYEILVGVNASSDHTAQVLEKHGIERVYWNARNDSIDYYRVLFDAAHGNTIIEIDDNIVELPRDFDLVLERHLAVFPDYGYIGFQPTRLDSESGARSLMTGAPDEEYQLLERDGLTLHVGPTWGCCAAITKRDWLDIGGFYGLRLSKALGEEPQITRKLRLHGRGAALLRGETLLKSY
ncbi:MAG: glycosyltransferase [Pseudomonadota bacterium]|nr:glycosyltransferase [Pseudomonadota bacterium]MDP2352429.1 glycosyltransferase [Pseudomonadota bacterium]